MPARRKIPWRAALTLRCPQCGAGKLFRSWFRMRPNCEQCGLRLEREAGFYLGSIYFNYGATVVAVGVAYAMLVFGFQMRPEPVLAGCLAFTLIFPLWFFRYSRSFFLAVDYYIHPERDAIESRPAPGEAASNGAAAGAANPLGAQRMKDQSADDATAGLVITLVIGLAILFGLALMFVVVASAWQMGG